MRRQWLDDGASAGADVHGALAAVEDTGENTLEDLNGFGLFEVLG